MSTLSLRRALQRLLTGLARIGVTACLAALSAGSVLAAITDTSSRLTLNAASDVHAAWPHVTILPEAGTALSAQEALSKAAAFERPTTSYATLGVLGKPVWLRVPFRIEGSALQEWIVNVDYPPLNRLDAYILQGTRTLQKAELGSLREFALRPLASRSHAMPFELAGGDYELLLRVDTRGALILPVEFMRPAAFHRASVAEQMLRGIQVGLFLCLLIYSLAQWAGTREPLFLKYALLVCGSFSFALLLSGVGAQWVWRDAFWFEQHMPGIGALLAVGGTFLFLADILGKNGEVATVTPGAGVAQLHTDTTLPSTARDRYLTVMHAGAALCAGLLAVYCLDLFNTAVLTALIVLLGPLPLLISLPRFVQRLLKGDMIGRYLLLAFAFYVTTVVITTSTIRGKLPANFWTLHSLTFGEMAHILTFTLILIQRAAELRRSSEYARAEHNLLRAMAYTDPLTGLANRRSLMDAMSGSVAHATPARMLAAYVVDLDDFKAVNDEFGHEAGDRLLLELANRLRSNARQEDMVARLGGDEFVVLAEGLGSVEQAKELGARLMRAAELPFRWRGREISIGITIGVAVAPHDGRDTATILRSADSAMYIGKQHGKAQLKLA